MQIPLQIEPPTGALADVDYRWDPDTDILSAQLRPGAVGEGASGAVEVEGKDGSWLTFDLTSGRIHGVEVAVWPTVQKHSTLTPPARRDCSVRKTTGIAAASGTMAYASGALAGIGAPLDFTSSSTRSTPSAQPTAGAGLPPICSIR